MNERIWARALASLSIVVWMLAPVVSAADEQAATGAPAELNRRFVDPGLDIDKWVGTFEVEAREVFHARREVLRATGVRVGERVADIGAGTGFYTRLFSEAVGQKGWVHAVDIGPVFLQHINQRATEFELTNVTAVLGRVDSVTLPRESIDLAFICDTYHHFETVEPTLASIHRALVKGGRLVVIEFDRIPGRSRQWVLDHVRAGKEVFRREIEAAGFAFVEEVEIPDFKESYLLKFKKK